MRTLVAVTMVALASGCVRHPVPTITHPTDVPIADRVGDVATTPEPSDRWTEAREELDDLVAACVETRARAVANLSHQERRERIALAGALIAYGAGTTAASRRGTTTVGPGPASYYPNYVYGAPAPATSGAPGLFHFGGTPPASTAPPVYVRSGGPIAERTDLVAVDTTHLVRVIDEEIESAYDDLEAWRNRAPTADDDTRLAEHEVRLAALCPR